MTLADELAPVFAEAAIIVADAVYANRYEVMRPGTTWSGSGGTSTETVVETGRCLLAVANRLGSEAQSAGQVLTHPSYTAEWLTVGIVTSSNTLRIDGVRTFNITDLKRDDHVTYADLEEV